MRLEKSDLPEGWPNLHAKSGEALNISMKIMNDNDFTWTKDFQLIVQCYKQKKIIYLKKDIAPKETWDAEFEFFVHRNPQKYSAHFGFVGTGSEDGEKTKYTSFKEKFSVTVTE